MAGINGQTLLLLSCDGTDGATTFPDDVSRHTLTAAGNAQVDTANPKWGTGALLLDGTGDWLTAPDSADWDIAGSASDSWTIDFWFDPDTSVDNRDIISQFEDASNFWVLRNYVGPASVIDWAVYSGGGYIVRATSASGAGIVLAGGYQHIAMCKVLTDWGIYIDGVQKAYVSGASTDTFGGADGKLYIGCRGTNNPIAGHLDEIRIQHSNYFNALPNVGLTNTITVPTGAYTRSGRNQYYILGG